MASRTTIATAMGSARPKAIAPAAARTTRISCVAYAVDDNASEAKTARPTVRPIVWCGASAVCSGRPMSHVSQERDGGELTVRRRTVVRPPLSSVGMGPCGSIRLRSAQAQTFMVSRRPCAVKEARRERRPRMQETAVRGLPPAFQASAPMDRALQVRKQTMSGKSQKDGLEGVSAVIRTIEAVARHPHPYPRTAAHSEAEGLPRPDRPSTRARTLPGGGGGVLGRGGGESFKRKWGQKPPHLLEVLYPLRAAPQRGSAMLRLVEDTHGPERGQGVRLKELRSAAKLIHEITGGTRAER